MTTEIMQDIVAAYGSLERPKWSFVASRAKSGLYDGLVKDLAQIGSVKETTDLNDDCSRTLFFSGGPEAVTVRLSFVGSYACIHDNRGRFLSLTDFGRTGVGMQLRQLLRSANIDVLSDDDLRRLIPFDGGQSTLYEVLFSSDGLIS